MKKLTMISLVLLLTFILMICVSAAEPLWQVSGSKIGIRGWGSINTWVNTDYYSHGTEVGSDFYLENKSEDGVELKHIIPVDFDTRPQKQINLDILIGNAEELMIVNNAPIIEDGFYVDFKAGMCVKVVVRTNYPTISILKSSDLAQDAEAPLIGNEKWEEVYFVIPDGYENHLYQFQFFVFGDTNKEDYPDGVYVDLAAVALFNNLADAKDSNIAPELIKTEEEPTPTPIIEPAIPDTIAELPDLTSKPAVTTAAQTFDVTGITVMGLLMSAGAFAICKKNNKK